MAEMIIDEFLDDLTSSNLILLGEKHEFYSHHMNNMSIQNLLVDIANNKKLNYNLALEHGDFQPEITNKEVYQTLEGDFPNLFNEFFKPLLDTVKRLERHNSYYKEAKLHFIGYHQGTHLENNQQMAQYLNEIVSEDSITLAIIGQRHLGSEEGYYATVQSYIRPDINTLTLLQAEGSGHDIISKIDRTHVKSPKYLLGIQ